MNIVRIVGPRTTSSYKYEFSKEDRTSVYRIEGSRTNTFRLPASASGSLNISSRYLVIQVRLRQSDSPTITLCIRDSANNKCNIAFSPAVRRRPSSSQTCALVNLDIPKNVWVNLCFDLEGVAQQYWVTGSYHSLDSVEISPSCFVRWVFAQNQPLDPDMNGSDLPHGTELSAGTVSTTVLVCCNEKSTKKSRIPVRPTLLKPKTAPQLSPMSSTRPKVSIPTTPPKTANTFTDKVSLEDEYSDDDAFDGVPAILDIDIKNGPPEGEEDELELVYIEALGCYYCPNNQQYYQLND